MGNVFCIYFILSKVQIFVVVVVRAAGRTAQALGSVGANAEEQSLRDRDLVGHYTVELLKVGCWEPSLFVVVDY
jgi:hypothetical protein